jgi:hypothetical protein
MSTARSARRKKNKTIQPRVCLEEMTPEQIRQSLKPRGVREGLNTLGFLVGLTAVLAGAGVYLVLWVIYYTDVSIRKSRFDSFEGMYSVSSQWFWTGTALLVAGVGLWAVLLWVAQRVKKSQIRPIQQRNTKRGRA